MHEQEDHALGTRRKMRRFRRQRIFYDHSGIGEQRLKSHEAKAAACMRAALLAGTFPTFAVVW